MIQAETTVRNERKFAVPDLSVEELESIIWQNPFNFHPIHHPRHVNSAYFDTTELHDYHAHISGAEKRQKYRLRWYGALRGVERPRLEIKMREGQVGRKVSYPIAPIDLLDRLEPQEIRLGQDVELDARHHARLRSSFTTVLTRYHRRYYLSADGRFRLTLDEQLSFLAPGGAQVDEDRVRVLELKYAPCD